MDWHARSTRFLPRSALMYYHNMSVKFAVAKHYANVDIALMIRQHKLFAKWVEKYGFSFDKTSDLGPEWFEILIEDEPSNHSEAIEAKAHAIALALIFGRSDRPIRVFNRCEEQGDNEGTYELVCKDKSLLIKHGIAAKTQQIMELLADIKELQEGKPVEPVDFSTVDNDPDLDDLLAGAQSIPVTVEFLDTKTL